MGAAPLAYGLTVVLSGGGADAWTQLTTQGDMITPGFLKYLWEPAFAAGALIGLLTVTMCTRPVRPGNPATDAGLLSFCGLAVTALLLAESSMAMAQGRYIGAPAFGLFGLLCGTTLGLATDRTRSAGHWQLGIVGVVVTWSTAMSIGYYTPALASAIAAAFLRALYGADAGRTFALRLPAATLIVALTVLCLRNFDRARLKYVYLERPASELACSSRAQRR